jgi:hypothetical protein
MAAAAAAAARKGVAYTVGRGLYLALTDKTNSRTVFASRGPGFAMSRESNFSPLGEGAAEPSATELAAVVDRAYDGADIIGMGENDPGVTFAGLGEPLLRVETLVETVATVRERRRALVVHPVGRLGTFCASASFPSLRSTRDLTDRSRPHSQARGAVPRHDERSRPRRRRRRARGRGGEQRDRRPRRAGPDDVRRARESTASGS